MNHQEYSRMNFAPVREADIDPDRPHRVCSKCIMDTSIPDITFDADGVCNYCELHKYRVTHHLHNDAEGAARLESYLDRIRDAGKGRDYDCLIGVSGGVDSTYVAYLLKTEYNLRPLAIHLDNGWDAELAQDNIERSMNSLGIDLQTTVLDWSEFREIQKAFLLSGLPNAEIPTDHAIFASLFQASSKYGIKHIITGSNIATESMVPVSWMYGARDLRLLKAVSRRYGISKIRDMPTLSNLQWAYHIIGRGVKFFPILNYIDFRKDEAKRILIDRMAWSDYGGKHFESIFTRFFQAYILPKKFRMDKRRPHLSNLIQMGEMSREAALDEIEKCPWDYPLFEQDYQFFVKKLGFAEGQFEALMNEPPRSVYEFPNSIGQLRRFRFLANFAKNLATRS